MSGMDRPAVFIATDGTERSGGAVRFGVEQARLLKSDVVLVHVTPVIGEGEFAVGYGPLSNVDVTVEGRATLARAQDEAEGLDSGVLIHGVHLQGDRVREVVAAAEQGALLVLGRETRRGIDRMFTGTTSADVVAHTGVPAVVVPADWVPAHRGRIVVAIKSQKYAAELLARALAAASSQGSTLRVVHVGNRPAHPESIDSESARREQEKLVAGFLEGWGRSIRRSWWRAA